jgi:hypothetical protein
MTPFRVRGDKAALSSGCKSRPATAPAEDRGHVCHETRSTAQIAGAQLGTL